MNRRETERILAAIHTSRAAGERPALATVVRVRGNAYRREGARILVRPDGSYECLLSGGCLEPAVADAAARVIATGTPVLTRYDLEEDSVWSLGIGCSGAVDIYIERVEEDPLTTSWLDALETAVLAVLVTPLSGATGRLLVREETVAGTLGNEQLDAAATARARERMRDRMPQSGAEQSGEAEMFYDVSTPPPDLVIFGAGSDAAPLAREGWELGFAVTVVDVRDAFLSAERFPHAARVCAHHSELPRAVRLSRRANVVIMNHHLERDRECLRFALHSEAAYIGVLGPRSRSRKLVSALSEAGEVFGAESLARVRSPIGLALGSETPEEIAVSIVGEILALERGFDGGFLNGRETGLHRSDSIRLLARS